MTELEQLQKDNEILKKDNEELRAVIKDNVSISNIIAKQLRSWQKICIITNAFWFVLFVVITFCVFVYYYNTEEVIVEETHTITQESSLNNAIIQGSSNDTTFMFNEDLGALNGETNLHKKN